MKRLLAAAVNNDLKRYLGIVSLKYNNFLHFAN